jgi:DNA-binding transcriptional LysR family regulator
MRYTSVPAIDTIVSRDRTFCRIKWNTMLDIEDLQTFVEVADSGGVSPAARRLGVSKSIVSRRLARLEAHLGAVLVSRTTRGAALTEVGTAFRDHAARICAELDEARETISPGGDLRGRLRITVSSSLGPTLLVQVLAELARRHPQLHVHTHYTEHFVDIVGEGFDCAIRIGNLADSNLVARRVGSIYAKLVASPEYLRKYGAPTTPDGLADHQILLQGTETWKFVAGDDLIVVHPQGRFKADNGAALAFAAVAGLGIAGLPDPLVIDHLKSGRLVELMPDYRFPAVGVSVVRPPGAHPSRKVRVLTELLSEHFGQT